MMTQNADKKREQVQFMCMEAPTSSELGAYFMKGMIKK